MTTFLFDTLQRCKQHCGKQKRLVRDALEILNILPCPIKKLAKLFVKRKQHALGYLQQWMGAVV